MSHVHSPAVSATLPLGWNCPYADAIHKGTMHLIRFQVTSALPSPLCGRSDTEKGGLARGRMAYPAS